MMIAVGGGNCDRNYLMWQTHSGVRIPEFLYMLASDAPSASLSRPTLGGGHPRLRPTTTSTATKSTEPLL
jgi:hypothetical protein